MIMGEVWVDDDVVRRLAAMLERRPLGRRLEQALLFRAQVIAMTRNEKEDVLAALARAPELEDVHDLLLADDNWREPRSRIE